jgi:spermidine/putrescine-binding protein
MIVRMERRRSAHACPGTLLIALAVLVAAAVAGCGGNDTTDSGTTALPAVTTAEVESASGSIGVAGWQFYEVPEAQDSGSVQSKWSYLNTDNDIITKGRSGEFDVVTASAEAMPALRSVNVLAPIDTSLLSNYDGIEKSLREDEAWKNEAGETVAVPFSVGPSLTVFDSSKVQEPKTLDDLLKPEFKDGIALYDAPAVIAGIATAQGVTNTLDMTHEQLEEAVVFLEELRPNIKTFFSYGEEVPLLNRGDVVATLDSYGTIVSPALENNPAIKFNFLAQVTLVNAFVITNEDNLAASLNWIDHAISVPGEKAIVASAGDFPTVTAAASAVGAEGDPVGAAFRGLGLEEILEQAPIYRGFRPDPEGDYVTIDEITRAWDEFKASF